MNRQTTKYPYAALVAACVFALAGCVSIAPLEPVKNPPTMFRSDNVVEVEFLHPATVGLRCGERGTQAFGMPVFHAMACGNGKLITMPDPCDTITGGDYAQLLCDVRSQPETQAAPVPEWQALLQPASYPATARPAPTPLKPRARNSVQVEFVHPSAVRQRCNTRGLGLVSSEAEDFVSCGDSQLITVPNPCMLLHAGWYPRTMCHEMAHANGWSMDHPGGSFLSDARAGVDPDDVPPPRAVLASLSASAPLRPASESPAYLAFVAARMSAFETRPAVYASMPAAAGLVAPVTVRPGQSAPDLRLAVLEYAAANRSFAHVPNPPELQFAALTGNARTLRPRLPLADTTRLAGTEATSSGPLNLPVLHKAAAAPQLRQAPAAPRPPAALWFAAVTRERATGSVALAAKWLAGALPDDPATIKAITAGLLPQLPAPPSAKPLLDRQWREEEAEPAAGV